MDFDTHRKLLDHALTATGRIAAGISEEHWALPTPCEGWDVRTVTNHVVGGLRIFTGQLTAEPVSDDHDGHDWLGPSPSSAYDAAAGADIAAWHRDDAEQQVFLLAFGAVPAPMALVVHLTEVLVHGLDLAVATNQEHLADALAAEQLLGLMRLSGTDAFRVPGIFGPEILTDPAAPAHRRLLAYLGRELAA